MLSRFGWLTGALTLGLASTVAVAQSDGRSNRPAPDRGGVLSLINGVTVSPGCAQDAATLHHISFSSTASHTFLGYGVNIEAERSSRNIPETIDILKKLGFVWVKVALARSDESAEDQSETAQSQRDAAPPVRPNIDLPASHKRLFEALHAAGIKVVDTIHNPPAAFFEITPIEKGRHGRQIKPDMIPQLAHYYAAYLRALLELGVRPDLIELINEPNLRQAGLYEPLEYASLIKGIEADLASPLLDANLSGPATAARVAQGQQFIRATQDQGALSAFKALTLHTYYVRDKPVNGGIPPADDPAFQSIVATAKRLGVPLISTEFGGTDLKTQLTDPEKESVDQAEEMKAALDLVRAGESAAIVWALHPYHKLGKTTNTWALIDAHGATNAYWLFYVLSRKIPVGSDVLAVKRSDVSPAIDSLGYAAFRSGRHVYVGLSNPAPSQAAASVSLDVSDLGRYGLVHAAEPLPDRAVESEMTFSPGTCPLNVTLPSGTSALLDINELR